MYALPDCIVGYRLANDTSMVIEVIRIMLHKTYLQRQPLYVVSADIHHAFDECRPVLPDGWLCKCGVDARIRLAILWIRQILRVNAHFMGHESGMHPLLKALRQGGSKSAHEFNFAVATTAELFEQKAQQECWGVDVEERRVFQLWWADNVYLLAKSPGEACSMLEYMSYVLFQETRMCFKSPAASAAESIRSRLQGV